MEELRPGHLGPQVGAAQVLDGRAVQPLGLVGIRREQRGGPRLDAASPLGAGCPGRHGEPVERGAQLGERGVGPAMLPAQGGDRAGAVFGDDGEGHHDGGDGGADLPGVAQAGLGRIVEVVVFAQEAQAGEDLVPKHGLGALGVGVEHGHGVQRGGGGGQREVRLAGGEGDLHEV